MRSWLCLPGGDAAIADQSVDVALEIAPDFAEAWHGGRAAGVDVVTDSTQRNAEVPVARVRGALEAYSQQVGALRLVARGIDPGVVRPVGLGTRDLASDAAKQSMVLAVFLPYLLLLSGFLGGIYLIVDATAGERERQSLEPLLATPAARGAIVSGKMAAGCVIGITSLLLTLLALKGSSMMGDTARMLDVRWLAIGKLLLILLPMVVIGTALFTFLAAAAKSVKEAQSHMSWLMLLPMVPSFVLMVNPIKTEGWQFAVPFLAQNQMILKVIRAEPIDAATWGMYLAAALALVDQRLGRHDPDLAGWIGPVIVQRGLFQLLCFIHIINHLTRFIDAPPRAVRNRSDYITRAGADCSPARA